MLKIALVWPKSTFLDNPLIWPPLGLLYLSSRLESMGHFTEFFDLNFTDLPNDGDYDQIWVSSTTPQILDVRRIMSIIGNWKTKKILGGAMAWDDPEKAKSLGFDLVVGGEADSQESIEQILYCVENPPENKYLFLKVAKTLDWVLPPNRKWALNYHSYMTDEMGNKYRMASIFGSRGCPMSCAFCSSGRLGVIWDKFVRYEPLESIEQQIKECAEMGFTGIGWYDDIMPLNKKRTLLILDILKKYNMKWRCFLRTDIICNNGGRDYLKLMKESGLIEIFLGVESADNRIKNAISKGTTIEQDTEVVNWCIELGILPKCSFIIGLPSEDRDSMEKTRNWILQRDPKKVRIQVDRLIKFPGTPISNNPEQYDLIWESPTDEAYFYKGREDIDMRSFVSTSFLTKEQIDIFYNSFTRELKNKGYRS